MIEYSKIYYYRYLPRGFGKLPVYDQFPLMLPLRVMGRLILGCNIHWIPTPLRYKYCNYIKSIYDRTDPKEAFRITYYTLKYNPSLSFTMGAIRKYYISGISNIIEIPGDTWNELPFLSNNKYRARYLKKIYAPKGLLK